MTNGFIKLCRGDKTRQMMQDGDAFLLVSIIAFRARRTSEFNIHGLKVGEALIGDCRNYGMSRQRYRTAKNKLKRWNIATFRTTNRGTIAKLKDNSVYDINAEAEQPTEQPSGNQQSTIKKPADNHPLTTNKKERMKKRKENRYVPDSFRLSQLLFDLIAERKPDFRKPDLERWAIHIDRMIRLDGRTPERIEAVIRWCQGDSFWQSNVLSTEKLREKFDQLELKSQGRRTNIEARRCYRCEKMGTHYAKDDTDQRYFACSGHKHKGMRVI